LGVDLDKLVPPTIVLDLSQHVNGRQYHNRSICLDL
jgi:hypothetical protein